jgi:hypothetical protein
VTSAGFNQKRSGLRAKIHFFKKFLLLFSHQVTRIGNRESRTFFASNAQVRPINKREILFKILLKEAKVYLVSFITVLISVNLCLTSLLCLLWLKIGQSKITNYAKQSQFPKSKNIYNRNYDNELQRKMNNEHLVKTNPNKANL